MPSAFNRVAVIVTPEQEGLLDRLGALQGRSRASYLRHLLEVATPSLRRLEASLRGVETVQAQLHDNISAAIDHAQEEMDDQLDLVWDTSLGQDADSPDLRAGRASRPARGAGDPPYSNTGVRLTGTGGVARKKRQKTAISQGG